MKWTCRDRGYWESVDGQWRITLAGEPGGWSGEVVEWRIYHQIDGRWRRSSIKGRHRTLASAKVAVVMFVEDAAR